jgi:hypothetical protein
MPKRGRTSIGYKRPKKKKVDKAATDEEHSDDVVDDEEKKDEDRASSEPLSPPVPSEPVPAQPPASAAEASGSKISTLGQRLRVKMLEAERHLRLIERRWEKKKKTLLDSPWDVQSKVRRTATRMLEADKELGEARAAYSHRRGRWIRWRTCHLLGKRVQENPGDDALKGLWLRAIQRHVIDEGHYGCERCRAWRARIVRPGIKMGRPSGVYELSLALRGFGAYGTRVKTFAM